MKTNLLLGAAIVWGVYLILHAILVPDVVVEYFRVGDGHVKQCVEEGGEFTARMSIAEKSWGSLRATCTLPSSTIVY